VSEIGIFRTFGRHTHGDSALRTARASFPPSSVIFGNLGPSLPGITSFPLGLLHIGQLIMYLSRAFTRYTLPNSPYSPWTHLLPLSMNRRTMALSTSPTPSRLRPCHPSPRCRMSIHPGCAHTRVTGLHYLNQSIVLFAPPSSRAQLTSTVTFGPVCSFQNPYMFHNSTYNQIQMNGSIVVTYVILYSGWCLCLLSPSDMSLRVYP